MAPEQPPYLVIFDAKFEGDELAGTVEYVEAGMGTGPLRVRWGVDQPPEGFVPVGNGVAYVHTEGAWLQRVPISTDARAIQLDKNRFCWTEGLRSGQPWLMFILILPEGYTVTDPEPAPAGSRRFGDRRLALYWTVPGDALGRTAVTVSLRPFKDDPKSELRRINRLLTAASSSARQTLNIESAPDSVSKAMLQLLWSFPRVYRYALLIAAGLLIAAFAIWSSLPDESKRAVIRAIGLE